MDASWPPPPTWAAVLTWGSLLSQDAVFSVTPPGVLALHLVPQTGEGTPQSAHQCQTLLVALGKFQAQPITLCFTENSFHFFQRKS